MFGFIHLQTASPAELGSLGNVLAVAVGVAGALDLLAKGADVHVLPVLDALHLGVELAGGAGGVHVTLDVLVDGSTLLEEADGVVVGADGVVGELHGLGDALVGVHEERGLFPVLVFV